jgi:hypothetical protein
LFKVVVISWRIRGHVDFAHQVPSAWITPENSMLCLIILLRTTTHSQLLEDDVNKFNTFNSIKEISNYRYCKYIELSLKIDTLQRYITAEWLIYNVARWSSDVSESDLSQVSNLQGHFETQIYHISNNRLCGVHDGFFQQALISDD